MTLPPVNITAGETSTTSANPTTPVNVKLLLIGNTSVGKSSLLLRSSGEQWIPEDEAAATIGADFWVSHLSWCRTELRGSVLLLNAPAARRKPSYLPFEECIQELMPIFCHGPGPQDDSGRKVRLSL